MRTIERAIVNMKKEYLQKKFDEYIKDNGYNYYINSWFDKENHSLDMDTDELYEWFLKERDENNSNT